MRPTHLSGSINVLGYASFADFNYKPLDLGYRLITYAFPLGAIVIYMLLSWRGPLRAPSRPPRTAPTPLVVDPAPALDLDSSPQRRLAASLVRVLLPALFVAVAASTASTRVLSHVGVAAVAWALVYVAVVLALACIARRVTAWAQDWELAAWVSVANAAAESLVAVGGVWFVSAHTKVIFENGSSRVWSWFPGWLAVLMIVGAWTWVYRQLHAGRAPDMTEQRLRIVLLGAAAVYVLVAAVPPAIASFQGFDDAQNLTGAYLLQHGYFPWRDFQFIHGLFPDGLLSLSAFHMFNETAWGTAAAIELVYVPLTWVGTYLLAVWAARRGSFIILGVLALAAWGGFSFDPRFVAFPLALLLLGKALSRRRLGWTITLTAVMFANAILVPESAFQVIAALAVLVISDFVHGPTGEGVRKRFDLTFVFVATGIVLTVLWAVFLASQNALGPYIDWFKIFAVGHAAEGTLPLNLIGGRYPFMFRAMVALVVATVLVSAWRIRARRPWTPVGWVTLAAAINAGLYGEEAIARWQVAQISYAVDVGMFLFVLVVASSSHILDDLAAASLAKLKQQHLPPRLLSQPVTIGALVVGIAAAPAMLTNAWNVSRRTHANLRRLVTGTGLGYATKTALPPGLLSDLRKVVDTYAPKGAPFLDMTNSPGYFYFLLGLRPASSLTNISLALTEPSQQMMVTDLRRTRPPLVAFNSDEFNWTTIGLPVWDDIENPVRSFIVSQYVLDNWTPILETHGVLFLLRNDLLRSRPATPHLSTPPVTTELYRSQPGCSWGYAANFLPSHPVGHTVTIPAQPVAGSTRIAVSGWAFDRRAAKAAKAVVVLVGSRVAAVGAVQWPSPAAVAALHTAAASNSEFDFAFATNASGPVSIYALTSDGKLHPVESAQAGSPHLTHLRLLGKTLRVVESSAGAFTGINVNPIRIVKFNTGSSQVSSYQLATLRSHGAIGTSQFVLSGSNNFVTPLAPITSAAPRTTPLLPENDDILANALPVTGSQLPVRVGACLAWHDYHGHTLYVDQFGGTPITSLTLSRVGS